VVLFYIRLLLSEKAAEIKIDFLFPKSDRNNEFPNKPKKKSATGVRSAQGLTPSAYSLFVIRIRFIKQRYCILPLKHPNIKK
jgi:hypothetical protein